MTEKDITLRRNLIAHYRKVAAIMPEKVKTGYEYHANRLESELEARLANRLPVRI